MIRRTTVLAMPSLLCALASGCHKQTELECTGMTEPMVLVVDRPCPSAVVGDGEYVYWVERCEDRIMRASLADGKAMLLVSGVLQPETLALDGDDLYFTTLGSGSSEDGTVARIRKAGGPVTLLATEQKLPWRLALYGERVYWVNLFDQAPLMSAPKDGSAPPAVVAMTEHNAHDLAVDAAGVYWVEHGAEEGKGAGAVLHCPAGWCPGGPSVIADDQLTAIAVELDEERLYWAKNGGAIVSAPRSQPAEPTEMHPSTLGGIGDVVLSGDTLVWTEGSAILSMPRQGGPVSTVASGKPQQAFASTISVRGSCLLYTTFKEQSVFAVGLP